MAVATLYLELAGAMLVETFPKLGLSKLWWTVVTTVLVLPSIFLRTLIKISISSFIAILAISSMFISVIVYSAMEINSSTWQFEYTPNVGIRAFTVSCGVLLFNFEASFAIAGVEETMKDRSKFDSMINFSYGFCTILLLAYSITPYIAFGNDVKEFIVYNMPAGPVFIAVSLLLVLKAIFTYPLFLFFIIDNFDLLRVNALPPCYGPTPKDPPPVWATIFRAVIVLSCLFFAVIVPHFAKFMGFIGSLVSPWMSFICPCIFYIKLKFQYMSNIQIITCVTIAVIAFLFGIFMTIASTTELLITFATSFP
ncbi:vesicular inhibitory amino acid transporter-like [Antedon mediterranea]|uniref:vesicular inhibitory amino acid transporter-like n=1 Tax=Antedon mediterranea TaxID=105859 RepID=UPI003AF910FF